MKIPKSLSPAAQAVLAAIHAAPDDTRDSYRSAGAAALRAAADQVVPEQLEGPTGSGFRWGAWATMSGVRSELLTIAVELENE